MQKILSYLYKNRIKVNANSEFLPVEWKLVYQHNIKIYQGVDNIIEFDMRNNYQRRISISNLTMCIVIFDMLGDEIYTTSVTPIPQTTGLAKAVIPAIAIAGIKAQFAKYSIYILDNGTKTPIYSDTQFGMSGTIEIIGDAMPRKLDPIIIDTFNYLIQDYTSFEKIFYSEAADINPRNDINENSSVDLEFRTTNLDATITVQITDNAVISSATKWHDIETFTIANTTRLLYKNYKEILDYSNNVTWLRVKYIPFDSTTYGTLDKILVRL